MKDSRTSIVDCTGCKSLCCRGDQIILHPEDGDDPAEYLTEMVKHPLSGAFVHQIQHTDSGDCVYLGSRGCTIWGRHPAICRGFDCADLFMRMTKDQRRAMIRQGFADRAVLDRGKKLAIARGLL